MQLNSAYQYVDYSPQSANKRASLSLSDLINTEDAGIAPVSTLPVTESSDYKKELAKLLAKSRGTAYEKTLKKFVETKYGEMQSDEVIKAASSDVLRSSLANLSVSKYDSPRKTSLFDDSVLNERKSRLDEIAQPSDRNKWKVSDSLHSCECVLNSLFVIAGSPRHGATPVHQSRGETETPIPNPTHLYGHLQQQQQQQQQQCQQALLFSRSSAAQQQCRQQRHSVASIPQQRLAPERRDFFQCSGCAQRTQHLGVHRRFQSVAESEPRLGASTQGEGEQRRYRQPLGGIGC